MKIELTENELELIIDWYYTADEHFGERGVEMLDKEVKLLKRLEELIKNNR